MTQTPSPNPPIPATKAKALADSEVALRKWTRQKMADFLSVLAETHSVAKAAKSVGMSRSSAYFLRQRLVGQPFDLAWEAALEHGLADLVHFAIDRAVNGVEVPHYHKGELVGTHRRYSDRLLTFLISQPAHKLGRMPGAREFAVQHWQELLGRVATGPLQWRDDGYDAELIEAMKDFRDKHSNHEDAIRQDARAAAARIAPRPPAVPSWHWSVRR